MITPMEELIRQQGRLIVLKALAEQVDETLNSDFLMVEIDRAGIRHDRAWLHLQLDWLAEMGAITVRSFGSIRVATLAETGARHLARKIAIEGIQRPSRPGV